MKTLQRRRAQGRGALLGAASAIALAACGGGQSSVDGAQATLDAGRTPPTTVAGLAIPAGRLMASNCFQCHGTNGTGGFEDIRGESASELIEFQGKPAGSNIMAAHAQGYTPDQLRAIAAYLNR